MALLATGAAAGAEVVRLGGDQGYAAQSLKALPPGSEVDARSALFRVANGVNEAPAAADKCEGGDLPVNRYPLQLRESAEVTLRGGLFAGEVSQTADWEAAYCNSAALTLRDSAGAAVEGLRMRRVWDALRVAGESGGFALRGSWFSEVRDDCIENDFLNGGVVEDTLLDGCFAGLSMRPPKEVQRSAAGGPVILRGVLMRMQPYPYKGRIRLGPPLKLDEGGPGVEIHDSVIAMDSPDLVSGQRLAIGWQEIGACSGNLLLWTADMPWPDDLAAPPDCFRLVEGAEARRLWQEARQNWIDCHPAIVRFAEDDASRPGACDPEGPGGASRPGD